MHIQLKEGDQVTIKAEVFLSWQEPKTNEMKKYHEEISSQINSIGTVTATTFGTACVKFPDDFNIKLPSSILAKL